MYSAPLCVHYPNVITAVKIMIFRIEAMQWKIKVVLCNRTVVIFARYKVELSDGIQAKHYLYQVYYTTNTA